MERSGDEFERLVRLRRDLHQYPELRFAEKRTSAALVAQLADIAEVRAGVAGTGLVAHLPGLASGPSVLLRADMDAYPVADGKDAPYASRNPGVCHACGHDVHMTVAYGVAARFAADPPAHGSLTVLFQPAEEIPFGQRSGAAEVLAEDAFEGRHFDAVLGLHCWPELPAGVVGVDRRTAMAAKDAFQVVLHGRAAHAATPARGRDAILGLSTLVNAVHAAVARSRDPHELAAFNIGTIAGGATQSLVADRAEATGTLRTHDPDTRARLKDVIERVARKQAAAFDLGIDFTWANEMPAIHNDPALVALAHRELPTVVGVADLASPPLTTDDFALLGTLGPSLYVKLGVGGQGGGASLHSAGFDVDERCIIAGVDAMERLTRAVLAGALDTPGANDTAPADGVSDTGPAARVSDTGAAQADSSGPDGNLAGTVDA